MARLTGGELLVDTLREHGIRQVFSIIGGQMCSIYDALSRRPEMRLINLRNEAAAPIMAAGCTSVTGVPAVSMCTVGAGVVYEVAGLLAAWYSYLPVISVAPQVQSWKMNPHQENLQGLNQDGVFQPVTKWNAIVYHWERIPQLVNRALREAQANAPGPVHLDVPVDVLFKTRKIGDRKKAGIMPSAATTRFSGAMPAPEEQIEKAREALLCSERPLIMVGQGMARPGRFPGLREVLNKLKLPALLSDCSLGTMNGEGGKHVPALGLFSNSETGIKAMDKADLLVVMGYDDEIKQALDRLGERPMVQVEADPGALLAGKKDHIGVNADPLSFLASANEALNQGENKLTSWNEALQAAASEVALSLSGDTPGPQALFKSLTEVLGEDDVLVVDGAEQVRAARAFLADGWKGNLYLMNTRDMAGAGLPFAIGAGIGVPDKKVSLITDKDSLFRHVQELQTAAGEGAGITIICIDRWEASSLERTRAVLEGLGCETARRDANRPPLIEHSPKPRAFLMADGV